MNIYYKIRTNEEQCEELFINKHFEYWLMVALEKLFLPNARSLYWNLT